MKKLLIILFTLLLFLAIAIASLLFTPQGNDIVKPYLKSELEKQIGLPVEVENFKLEYDNMKLNFVVSNALKVEVKNIFDIYKRTFEGTYRLNGDNFLYKEVELKEINLNGEYKGVPDDLFVNGKGSSFNAPLEYYFRLVNSEVKEMVMMFKDMDIRNFLAMLKQPALAQGRVDANITVPSFATKDLEGQGSMAFTKMTFNDALLKEKYNLSLPEGTQMEGTVDLQLKGVEVKAKVDMKSPLVHFVCSRIKYNTKTQFITTDYLVDVENLKPLSTLLDTQLSGALVLKGKVEKREVLKVTGVTDSLGGGIRYDLLENDFHASVRAVPVENMLHLMKFPKFAGGNASGDVNYNILTKKGGSTVTFGKFKFAQNAMTRSLRVMFKKDPSSIIFGNTTLNAEIDGDEIIYSFRAKAGKASVEIGKGLVNHKKGTHEAQMKVMFGKYSMQGSIGGTLRHPHIGFNIKGFTKDQLLDNSFAARVKKFIKKVW